MILRMTRNQYVSNVKTDGIYRGVKEESAIFGANVPRVYITLI
jgi:hypothetical protein